MASNPRIPYLPPDYSWEDLNRSRKAIGNIDPTMGVQPPTDQSYMPNVTTTPPPPDVWMANAGQGNGDQMQQLLRALQILRASRA